MFGSQILEVGIGLILVFLLVSLILTAVQEAIESWFKTRSRDLEHAIAELLDDRDGTELRSKLYNHPLIYALFPGGVTPTKFTADGGVESRGRRNLPAYIPRETFAIALEDLISQGEGSDRLHSAYAALDTASGGDVEKIRKGVEAWYDASMDRASGWFKRRTQWALFWLGLAVAIGLNVNAITIAQYLATNQAARDGMVKLAGEIDQEHTDAKAKAKAAAEAKAKADAAAKAKSGTAAPKTEVSPDGQDGATGNETANEAAAPVPDPAPLNEVSEANRSDATGNGSSEAGGNSATSAGGTTAGENPDSDAARIAESMARRVQAVGLPVGWDPVQVKVIEQQFKGRSGTGWLASALTLLLGYLMVAFAATLGAPFWFDLLGKFMVVRSTVKPKEKSRDEASKDGGTGGAPVVPGKAGKAGG